MTASLGLADNDQIAQEQAALRRVATLAARVAPPGQVLTAVTGQAGRLLGADHATMGRYSPDAPIRVLATWGNADVAIPVGARHKLGGQDLHTMIFQTRRPARIDDSAGLSGDSAQFHRKFGIRAGVGVPGTRPSWPTAACARP